LQRTQTRVIKSQNFRIALLLPENLQMVTDDICVSSACLSGHFSYYIHVPRSTKQHAVGVEIAKTKRESGIIHNIIKGTPGRGL
jgi:hypothetical protein